MIYYPLATLMLAGIRSVLIISTPHDVPALERLLSDGSQWGIQLEYAVQPKPRGIAEAFTIGADFIGQDQVCLILGDNLFYGKLDFLRRALTSNEGATIFAYRVHDPERYGVVEFGPDGRVLSIEEKPRSPRSSYAIPGLYVFSPDVVEFARTLRPSARGELEITDVQRLYLEQNRLRAELIGRGVAWLDTGTPEALLEASQFIHAIEKRQGLKIACLEEIALSEGFITREALLKYLERLPNCSYRDYCLRIADEAAQHGMA